MNEQYAALITGFPLFAGFTVHGAQMLLESGQVKSYVSGEMLFKEGDPASFTLLVLTGKLQVFLSRQGREVILQETTPGTVLGELAVVCGIARSASVRASENSAVLQWTAEEFRKLLLRNKLLSDRVLGQTLRTLLQKEQSLVEALTKFESAVAPETEGSAS
jgi:CRP-like cAMP-binding protein